MSKYIELAMNIQSIPVTTKSSEDLAEIIGMIQRMTHHLSKQMEKGIAMEVELNKMEALAKDLPGAKIYVSPWGCLIDSTNLQE
jgi:hypothetical protein